MSSQPFAYASSMAEFYKIQQSIAHGPLGPIEAPMVYLSVSAIAARSATTPETLVGLAAPYHRATIGEDGHRFMFARGCFEGSLTLLQCYLNHEHSMRLGCSQDGTLRVFDHDDGLYFSLALGSELMSENVADALREADRAGRLSGVSAGWVVRQQHYSPLLHSWLVTRAELHEISILSASERPRFAETWVTVGTDVTTAARRHRAH